LSDIFWAMPLTPYEAVEVPPETDPMCAETMPAGKWMGPISSELARNMERGEKHLWFGGFGSDGSGTAKPKKYQLVEEHSHDDGSFHMWRYAHCSRTYEVLIREVPKSPEIHLHLQDVGLGTRVTAVAEDGSGILVKLVHHDERLTDFKREVKSTCCQLGLCTMSTDLTIYLDNVLLTSNTMLRAEFSLNKKNRMPRVFPAEDGNLHGVPQSRNLVSTLPVLPTLHVDLTCDDYESDAAGPAKKKHKAAVAGNDTGADATCPAAKKQKTAGATPGHPSSGADINGVDLLRRPSASPQLGHSSSSSSEHIRPSRCPDYAWTLDDYLEDPWC
jgi:hypothetical protein